MRSGSIGMLVCVTAMAVAPRTYAKVECSSASKHRYEDTLECYQRLIESQPLQYELKETARLSNGVTVRTGRLTARSWPPGNRFLCRTGLTTQRYTLPIERYLTEILI